jgi:hypothetical protein
MVVVNGGKGKRGEGKERKDETRGNEDVRMVMVMVMVVGVEEKENQTTLIPFLFKVSQVSNNAFTSYPSAISSSSYHSRLPTPLL